MSFRDRYRDRPEHVCGPPDLYNSRCKSQHNCKAHRGVLDRDIHYREKDDGGSTRPTCGGHSHVRESPDRRRFPNIHEPVHCSVYDKWKREDSNSPIALSHSTHKCTHSRSPQHHKINFDLDVNSNIKPYCPTHNHPSSSKEDRRPLNGSHIHERINNAPSNIIYNENPSRAPRWTESGYDSRMYNDLFQPRVNRPLNNLNYSFVPKSTYPDYIDLSPPRDAAIPNASVRYYPLRRDSRDILPRKDIISDIAPELNSSPHLHEHLHASPPHVHHHGSPHHSHHHSPIHDHHHSPHHDHHHAPHIHEVHHFPPHEIHPIVKAKDDFNTGAIEPLSMRRANDDTNPYFEGLARVPSQKEAHDRNTSKSRKGSKRPKDTIRPMKRCLRKVPEEPTEVYHMNKDPESIEPRMKYIGDALFNDKKLKTKAPKKRVVSAQPRSSDIARPANEREYIETLYPHIDYGSSDVRCSEYHYQPWLKNLLKKVFEKENKVKYDMFIKRCIKTSPYHENSGYNYALLKRLAKIRKPKPKKNYERNTIASLAKVL